MKGKRQNEESKKPDEAIQQLAIKDEELGNNKGYISKCCDPSSLVLKSILYERMK